MWVPGRTARTQKGNTKRARDLMLLLGVDLRLRQVNGRCLKRARVSTLAWATRGQWPPRSPLASARCCFVQQSEISYNKRAANLP